MAKFCGALSARQNPVSQPPLRLHGISCTPAVSLQAVDFLAYRAEDGLPMIGLTDAQWLCIRPFL